MKTDQHDFKPQESVHDSGRPIFICKKCGYAVMDKERVEIKRCPAWIDPEWRKA
jgi:rubrerythrin